MFLWSLFIYIGVNVYDLIYIECLMVFLECLVHTSDTIENHLLIIEDLPWDCAGRRRRLNYITITFTEIDTSNEHFHVWNAASIFFLFSFLIWFFSSSLMERKKKKRGRMNRSVKRKSCASELHRINYFYVVETWVIKS